MSRIYAHYSILNYAYEYETDTLHHYRISLITDGYIVIPAGAATVELGR